MSNDYKCRITNQYLPPLPICIFLSVFKEFIIVSLDYPVSSTGQASQVQNDEGKVGMNKLKSPAASFVKEGFIMPIAFYMDIKYFY
jgi:hypothetical protein